MLGNLHSALCWYHVPHCLGSSQSKEDEECLWSRRGDAGDRAELGNPATLDASQNHELANSTLSPAKLSWAAGAKRRWFMKPFCWWKDFPGSFAAGIPAIAQAGDSRCWRHRAGMG